MLLRKERPVVSIRHALLALLSEGPKYGLQLRQEFEAKTGEVWPLNVGQVYTTLQRLERDGLVESDDAAEDGPQKGFHITEEGAEELATWLRTPPDFSSPPRDELVIKVLVALGLPGVDVHEVIQVHRRYVVQLMQQWTRLKEDEAGFDIQFALVVDAELFRLDSVVQLVGHGRWPSEESGGGGRRAGPPVVPPPQGQAQGGSEAMSYLELRDISKIYGEGAAEVRALQRIDLSVDAGSLVAVMGASGSGKSTLLTIAGSLEDPTSGEVYLGGQPLSSLSRNGKARLRRRSIGYVFQDYNLLAGLSAVENVSLPLELDGVAARKAQAAAMESLEDLGLAERSDRYPDQLSGGERQRVAIARAVVGGRQLLLADEPSGALDSTNAEAVMRLILAACHRGLAAIVVTHDAQLASWADRVVFLRDGRVVDQTLPLDESRGAPRRRPAPMSVGVLDRPVAQSDPAPTTGGVPARRAMIRWAWRLFKREWRQQLLILLLVVVAVAAVVVGAAVAVNTPPPANAGFGTAARPGHVTCTPGPKGRRRLNLHTVDAQIAAIGAPLRHRPGHRERDVQRPG